MTDPVITKTVFFAASRETVWAFLTEKDKLGEWFHPAKSDLAEGEDYALLAKGDDGELAPLCWGTVLEMARPSHMQWTFTATPLNGLMTKVTWTLEEVTGGTRLTMVHTGLEAAGQDGFGLVMALDVGWDEHFGRMRNATA